MSVLFVILGIVVGVPLGWYGRYLFRTRREIVIPFPADLPAVNRLRILVSGPVEWVLVQGEDQYGAVLFKSNTAARI